MWWLITLVRCVENLILKKVVRQEGGKLVGIILRMAMHDMLTSKFLHKLSKRELATVVPQGTFTRSLHNLCWKEIEAIVASQPDMIQDVILHVAEEKVRRLKKAIKVRKKRNISKRRMVEGGEVVQSNFQGIPSGSRTMVDLIESGFQHEEEEVNERNGHRGHDNFMKLLTEDE